MKVFNLNTNGAFWEKYESSACREIYGNVEHVNGYRPWQIVNWFSRSEFKTGLILQSGHPSG